MELIGEVLLTKPSFLVTTFVTVFIFYIARWWKNNKKFYDLAAQLEKPNLSCYPIIGHAHHYITLQGLIKVQRSFNSPCSATKVANLIMFYLNDADLAEELFLNDKCWNKPKYVEAVDIFGNGLLLSKGERWRKHRKLLNPIFNLRILNSYVYIFWKYDRLLIDELKEKIGVTFDINFFSRRCAFRKFCDFALGLDSEEQSDEYWKAMVKGLHIQIRNAMNVFHCFNIFYRFSKSGKELDKCVQTIRRISHEIIEKKQDERSKEREQSEIVQTEDTKTKKFIDYLLDDDGKNYNRDDIVDELTTFVFAGMDTCSNNFSFLCVCLGLHPDIQEKVYEEIYDVLGGDRHVEHTDLAKLKYLETVVKETLRMFPPITQFPRSPIEDVKIGEYIFPKDSAIHANVLDIHYSEKYYADPYTFNPDRFQPAEVKKRHKYAYIPFSAGKRNCIGEKFGTMALLTLAANFFQAFRVETIYTNLQDIRLQMSPTLNAVDGCPIRIFPRN